MKNLFDRGIIAASMRRIRTLGIVAGILAMVQVVFSSSTAGVSVWL